MEKEFISFIEDKTKSSDKLLLACSGGPDSIALFHLLLESNREFEVAHVNYHLREKESDLDQKLVENICIKENIPCFVKLVNIAKSEKSIQQEAREIRYEFFKEVMSKRSIKYLLTGHHQTDLVENILFRLIRGTGLKGLVSFSAQKESILRPLISHSKDEILSYLNKNNIEHRIDESNKSNNYSRNKIRNLVLPILESIFPNYLLRVQGSVQRLRNDYELLNVFIKPYKEKLIRNEELILEINSENSYLVEESFWAYLHNELNETISKELSLACKNKKNGCFIETPSLHINIIANRVEIQKRKLNQELCITVEQSNSFLFSASNKGIKGIIEKGNHIKNKPNWLSMDVEKVQFPIKFRNHKKGDKFIPLGMQGNKLLSDFYNDLKINATKKKSQIVMEDSTGQIIACIPHRISELVKVSKETKNCLHIALN